MTDTRDQHPTLQDDRAALEIDAEDASPLVEGEGAPLAEDGVAAKPRRNEVVVTQGLLGGAPVAAVVPFESEPGLHDRMAAPDDKPIGD
jgi:hypothetical protein